MKTSLLCLLASLLLLATEASAQHRNWSRHQHHSNWNNQYRNNNGWGTQNAQVVTVVVPQTNGCYDNNASTVVVQPVIVTRVNTWGEYRGNGCGNRQVYAQPVYVSTTNGYNNGWSQPYYAYGNNRYGNPATPGWNATYAAPRAWTQTAKQAVVNETGWWNPTLRRYEYSNAENSTAHMYNFSGYAPNPGEGFTQGR